MPAPRGGRGFLFSFSARPDRLSVMMWWIYQVLFAVGFILMLPHFLMRMRRRGGYAARFGDRFARYPPAVRAAVSGGGRVWIHAVSVGEIYVGLGFARELRARRPELRFLFTYNTPTARGIADAQADPRDVTAYFPLDFPWVMRRALNLIRPRALFLVEGEIWPNLVRQCAARGIPVGIINARMSDRSFRGYRRIRPWMRRVLLRMRGIWAQSAEVRQRLVALGAAPESVQVAGSAKYEVAARDAAAEARAAEYLRRMGWGPERRILLGGSTWEGEEAALLDMYRRLRSDFSGLALLLAPRHAERRAQVRAAIEASGLAVALRSETAAPDAPAPASPPDVLLLDTTGELRHFYAAAEVIFIGKSLTQHGGQNPIEPASCRRPVVVGPHMENFREIMNDFRSADAIREVRDPAGLETEIGALLGDPDASAALGERGARLVRDQAGALARTAEAAAGWPELQSG